MKIVAKVILALALIAMVIAMLKTGARLNTLTANAWLRITNTMLLASIALGLLGCNLEKK